jgi:hypothetical protein
LPVACGWSPTTVASDARAARGSLLESAGCFIHALDPSAEIPAGMGRATATTIASLHVERRFRLLPSQRPLAEVAVGPAPEDVLVAVGGDGDGRACSEGSYAGAGGAVPFRAVPPCLREIVVDAVREGVLVALAVDSGVGSDPRGPCRRQPADRVEAPPPPAVAAVGDMLLAATDPGLRPNASAPRRLRE